MHQIFYSLLQYVTYMQLLFYSLLEYVTYMQLLFYSLLQYITYVQLLFYPVIKYTLTCMQLLFAHGADIILKKSQLCCSFMSLDKKTKYHRHSKLKQLYIIQMEL